MPSRTLNRLLLVVVIATTAHGALAQEKYCAEFSVQKWKNQGFFTDASGSTLDVLKILGNNTSVEQNLELMRDCYSNVFTEKGKRLGGGDLWLSKPAFKQAFTEFDDIRMDHMMNKAGISKTVSKPYPSLEYLNKQRVLMTAAIDGLDAAAQKASAPAGSYSAAMNDIAPRLWQFSRGDGSLIASRIQLMADGKIVGYASPNESSWGLENGAVVLYNKDKKPTTKFLKLTNDAGKVTLSGPFIPAPQHLHVLTSLTPSVAKMDDITKRLWKFGRGDGSVIAPKIQLMPDGKILGYAHPNEAGWKLDNGAVVFLNQAGQPTSRFDSMVVNGSAVTLSGPFLLQPQIAVVLTEVGMTTPPAVAAQQPQAKPQAPVFTADQHRACLNDASAIFNEAQATYNRMIRTPKDKIEWDNNKKPGYFAMQDKFNQNRNQDFCNALKLHAEDLKGWTSRLK